MGSRIGIKIDPDGIHVMKKSHYSGMFGDYSSYSEEYEDVYKRQVRSRALSSREISSPVRAAANLSLIHI